MKTIHSLIKHHAIKTYWWIGGVAPRILTWAVDVGEWSVSRSGLHYQFDRRLGGPKNWPGRGGKGKTSHHCPFRELNPELELEFMSPGRHVVSFTTASEKALTSSSLFWVL